jgi:hypothetical protein
MRSVFSTILMSSFTESISSTGGWCSSVLSVEISVSAIVKSGRIAVCSSVAVSGNLVSIISFLDEVVSTSLSCLARSSLIR